MGAVIGRKKNRTVSVTVDEDATEDGRQNNKDVTREALGPRMRYSTLESAQMADRRKKSSHGRYEHTDITGRGWRQSRSDSADPDVRAVGSEGRTSRRPGIERSSTSEAKVANERAAKDDSAVYSRNGHLSSTPHGREEEDPGSLDLGTEYLPHIDTAEAVDKAAARIRYLVRHLEKGDVPLSDLKKNLEYAASVLETVYLDETRRLYDEDDELSEVNPDAVPNEVRDWLASTFTRQFSKAGRTTDEKPKFRSIVQAVRAGIFVDRIYRRLSGMSGITYPPQVINLFKNVDDWSFSVFALNDASENHALKYMAYELFTRYDLISKFKIPVTNLNAFLDVMEAGYSKYKNPYHNLIHAADVTQTIHHVLVHTGLMHWLTDLEILASLLAALIHDYEHTGTTNNFHVNSRSETALLYNDRAVLENHHISCAFRVLLDEDKNILSNLSRDEYRECRSLVIDMVLATDMSYHFQQIKQMKNLLSVPENIDKSKALSLVLHCADISHPAKDWPIHYRWTELLMEEFFRQGDKEQELGIPFSPLCDRSSTVIAESQIGFIDFIVDPSFQVLGDMLEKIIPPGIGPRPIEEASLSESTTDRDGDRKSSSSSSGSSGSVARRISSTGSADSPVTIRRSWADPLQLNRHLWKERARKDAEAKAAAEAANADAVAESENEVSVSEERKSDASNDSGVDSTCKEDAVPTATGSTVTGARQDFQNLTTTFTRSASGFTVTSALKVNLAPSRSLPVLSSTAAHGGTSSASSSSLPAAAMMVAVLEDPAGGDVDLASQTKTQTVQNITIRSTKTSSKKSKLADE
ncbi:dual specificity calcium/calmodulin-dependent 3',5'-cyclic nucleotide phosphodiesterase 1A-like isoform X5 [Ptychodera flava]|uniref:dual specificity calcium/calmodulin-dependent 3',5'-cyclic nucleotide phosphodiesterase 1A-like isoform X5 n=1 Tax=Ptychodera flava TaxID=63121 RepID=UPI00396A026E